MNWKWSFGWWHHHPAFFTVNSKCHQSSTFLVRAEPDENKFSERSEGYDSADCSGSTMKYSWANTRDILKKSCKEITDKNNLSQCIKRSLCLQMMVKFGVPIFPESAWFYSFFFLHISQCVLTTTKKTGLTHYELSYTRFWWSELHSVTKHTITLSKITWCIYETGSSKLID